jgi:hypothetical protein
MTTLMRWRRKVMPQNDAAAMAESVIAADIGASNDNAVTGSDVRGQISEVRFQRSNGRRKARSMQNALAKPADRRNLLKEDR